MNTLGRSRELPGMSGTRAPTQRSSSGSVQAMLRGGDFASQSALLSPVQAKGLLKPGLKSKLAGKHSSYNQVYKLWGAWKKAKGTAKDGLARELGEAIERWITGHGDDTSKTTKARLQSLRELKSTLAPSGEVPPPIDVPPPIEDTDEDVPPPTDVPPQVPPPIDVPPPPQGVIAPPQNVPTPPMVTPPSIGDRARELGGLMGAQGPSTTSVTKPTPEELRDPTQPIETRRLMKCSASEIITYLDTQPKPVVEGLRSDQMFTIFLRRFSARDVAQIAVRIVLRVPGTVVDRGGSRTEALRILSSQLNDKDMALRLITSKALVVIVPRNMLMTDLDEFVDMRNTYTFDGRPWDTTRGVGSSKNTAITEENLTGEDISSSPSMSRTGQSGTSYSGVNNPQVYCSGYSTTNHEFFHTLHRTVLTKQQSAVVKSAYDSKHNNDTLGITPWADGTRMKDGTVTDNYSSVNEFEYLAQTGCAYQGTNAGTDPYTGQARNNGRQWVLDNESPAIVALLEKMCGTTALTDVNPRDRKALERATPTATATATVGVTGVISVTG